MPVLSSKFWSVFRFLFTTAILCFVLFKVDWAEMLDVMFRANYFLFAIAFMLQIVGVILQGLRWHIFLKSDGERWPFWKTQFVNFVSFFHDLYIPGKIGSDSYRIVFFRNPKNTHHVVTSLLALRLQGLTVTTFSAILAGLFLFDVGTCKIPGLIALLLLTLSAFLLLRKMSSICAKEYNPARVEESDGKVKVHLFKIVESTNQILKDRRIIISSFFVAFAFLFLGVIKYAIVGEAFQLALPFTSYLFGVPILFFAAVVPVTIHGRGITELLAIYFWQGKGATQEQVLLICLGVYVLAILQSLLSGCCWTFLRPTERVQEQ